MLRRNSVSRRRLSSHEYTTATATAAASPPTSPHNNSTNNNNNNNRSARHLLRSRSQERSLNRSRHYQSQNQTQEQQEEEEYTTCGSSRASSTAGSAPFLEDQDIDNNDNDILPDPLDNCYHEEMKLLKSPATLVGGVLNPTNNRVVITTTNTKAKGGDTTTTTTNGNGNGNGVTPPTTSNQHSHQHNHQVPLSPKYHRRAQSDPIDISGIENVHSDQQHHLQEDAETTTVSSVSSWGDDPNNHNNHSSSSGTLLPPREGGLPTLPRYPVAETRDLNCWSESPLDVFRVRGASYLTDKKKVASAPYLLRARGSDLFLLPEPSTGSSTESGSRLRRTKSKSTASKPQPPNVMDQSPMLLNGTLRREPTLVLNFRFPWGLMLLYFEIPPSVVPFLNHVPTQQHYSSSSSSTTTTPTTPKSSSHKKTTSTSTSAAALPRDLAAQLDALSPGERTLALWIMGDDHYKNQRLKLIPYVVQGPWVVRNMVTGKPAIIGTKLPVSYSFSPASSSSSSSSHAMHASQAPLLVVELDIGNSSTTAKRIVSVCRRYMNALTCDIGVVIQGNSTSELPEQMLGATRIHGIDPCKAPTLLSF